MPHCIFIDIDKKQECYKTCFITFVSSFTAIEAQIKEIQSKKKEIQAENGNNKGVSLGETYYDSDIYDSSGQAGKSRYDGYVTSIAANDEVEDEDVENVPTSQKRPGYTAPASLLNDIAQVSTQN